MSELPYVEKIERLMEEKRKYRTLKEVSHCLEGLKIAKSIEDALLKKRFSQEALRTGRREELLKGIPIPQALAAVAEYCRSYPGFGKN